MERMYFSGTAKGPHLSFKQMFEISVMFKNDTLLGCAYCEYCGFFKLLLRHFYPIYVPWVP